MHRRVTENYHTAFEVLVLISEMFPDVLRSIGQGRGGTGEEDGERGSERRGWCDGEMRRTCTIRAGRTLGQYTTKETAL